MGTEFTVYLDAPNEVQAQACFQTVFDEIDRVERTFSRFQPSSEISRINSLAWDGPMVTDPEVLHLLTTAFEVSVKTGGAFDITVGRLTRLWRLAEQQAGVRDEQEFAAARESAGWRNLRMDAEWRTVQFLRPGMELDLGAIAKGYAVDCALEALRPIGVPAMIDAGSSSIAATGEPFSSSWKMSIASPLDRSRGISDVRLGDRALSTSGTMEQSFVRDGRAYGHLIDPVTPEHEAKGKEQLVLQVTVLAPNSTLADAISTAMFILGPERGGAVLTEFADCSALWVCSDADRIACYPHQWPEQNVLPDKEEMHGQA